MTHTHKRISVPTVFSLLFCLPKQLEQSLKGEEVVSKEIMSMTELEIENEIKEVRKFSSVSHFASVYHFINPLRIHVCSTKIA